MGTLRQLAVSGETQAMRADVLQAIGAMGAEAKSAIGPLLRQLQRDPSFEVRGDAARALGNIGPDAREALESAQRSIHAEARDAGAPTVIQDVERALDRLRETGMLSWPIGPRLNHPNYCAFPTRSAAERSLYIETLTRLMSTPPMNPKGHNGPESRRNAGSV